ncbi:hypothetical protein DW928_07040 [Firmicutes bacterium AM43-11BH]|nr:hypothetical protein DW928_07040 [Firmicutes bacterium AM43-11BH]
MFHNTQFSKNCGEASASLKISKLKMQLYIDGRKKASAIANISALQIPRHTTKIPSDYEI